MRLSYYLPLFLVDSTEQQCYNNYGVVIDGSHYKGGNAYASQIPHHQSRQQPHRHPDQGIPGRDVLPRAVDPGTGGCELP